MKKNSNNYKGTTAIGKYTEVLKRPELGESTVPAPCPLILR